MPRRRRCEREKLRLAVGVPLAASSVLMREQHSLSEVSWNRSAHGRGSGSTGCWEGGTSGSRGPGPGPRRSSGPALACVLVAQFPRCPQRLSRTCFRGITCEGTRCLRHPRARAAECVPWDLPATQQDENGVPVSC